MKANSFNCYSIQLTDAALNLFYGNITNFISINDVIYIVVQIFKTNNKNYIFPNLRGVVNIYIHRFYNRVELSDTFLLIKPVNIIRRCVLIQNYDCLILSSCVDLTEHD